MDNLSTVDKLPAPNLSFIERFHCTPHIMCVLVDSPGYEHYAIYTTVEYYNVLHVMLSYLLMVTFGISFDLLFLTRTHTAITTMRMIAKMTKRRVNARTEPII